ncbi:MAG: zinc-ribbon domain-containing protein [bacterium]
MKCPKCDKENSEQDSFCVSCGEQLGDSAWIPGWKWHAKVLAFIYVVLFMGYFILKAVIK